MAWEPRPPLRTARGGLDSVEANGVIYAIGGFDDALNSIYDSVEMRDSVSGEWTLVKPMSMPRANPGAACLNGRIYVIGGNTGPHNDSNKGESFDTSDPSTSNWTRIKNRPAGPILGLGAAAFDGRVYIFGGGERPSLHAGLTNAVSIYDPATDKWSGAKPMPTARYLLRAVELDGQIYAVGGRVDGNNPFSKALERYDPTANTWDKLHPMSIGRGNPGVAVAANGRIVVVGGGSLDSGSPGPSRSVEEYNPQTDIWTPLEPLPVARASLSAERGQGNTILAIGGFEPNDVASTRVESLLI